MNKPDNLTDKQWAFVLEYGEHWNATDAYMSAYGQKDKNVAASCGSRLLSNAKIRTALKGAYEQAAMPLEEMLAGIASIARDEGANNNDRLRAYELIGKGHAAFTDKVKSDVDLNINVRFNDDLDS